MRNSNIHKGRDNSVMGSSVPVTSSNSCQAHGQPWSSPRPVTFPPPGSEPRQRQSVLVSVGALTSDHELGGVQQWRCVLSLIWKPEV